MRLFPPSLLACVLIQRVSCGCCDGCLPFLTQRGALVLLLCRARMWLGATGVAARQQGRMQVRGVGASAGSGLERWEKKGWPFIEQFVLLRQGVTASNQPPFLVSQTEPFVLSFWAEVPVCSRATRCAPCFLMNVYCLRWKNSA